MDEDPCVTFLWTIENFYYSADDDGDSLESPEFDVNVLNESVWKLCIDPYCKTKQDEFEVYLQKDYSFFRDCGTFFIDYEISFLSNCGSILFSGTKRNKKVNRYSASFKITNYPTYGEVFNSRKEEFLSYDTLKIQCRIWKSRTHLRYPLQYSAVTRLGRQIKSFHWAIKNFSKIKGTERTRKIKWGENEPVFFIKLFLNGDQSSASIEIEDLSTNFTNLCTTWKISVLNATGNTVKNKMKFFHAGVSDFRFPRFLTKNDLTERKGEFLIGDVLNLLFEFTFRTENDFSNIESVSSVPTFIQNTLHINFLHELLENMIERVKVFQSKTPSITEDNFNSEIAHGASLENAQGTSTSLVPMRQNITEDNSNAEAAHGTSLENAQRTNTSLVPMRQNITRDNSNAEVADGASLENTQERDRSWINISNRRNDESVIILQEDLLSLYKDHALSDFELRVGSESFPVQKIVLIARSPVFKAMFSSDMREGSAEFLDIPDVDADTLDRLLKFVYTGAAAILDWECACKLYYASDKYEILSLKQKCSTFLASNITDYNFCEILSLADRHNDEILKSVVLDFIMLNDNKIIRSTDWKDFSKRNPLLALETMQLVFLRR